MKIPVNMPKVGLTIEEAEVIEWFGTAGEAIGAGEPLLVVNADKADVVIDAPSSGVLVEVSVDVGAVVLIGQQLGIIDDGADPMTSPTPERGDEPSESPTAHASIAAPSPTDRVRISPYARRLCREHGVDVADLVGSGPHGRIVARDVHVAERSAHRSAGVPISPTSATLTANVDAVELLGVVAAGARIGMAVEPLHVVAWATGQTLLSHPFANVLIDAGGAPVSSARCSISVIDSNDRRIDVADPTSLLFADLVDVLHQPHRSSFFAASVTILDLSADRVVAVSQPVEPPSTLLVTVGAFDDRTRLTQGRMVTRPALSISLSYLPRVLTAHMAGRVLFSIAANVAAAGEVLNSLPHRAR